MVPPRLTHCAHLPECARTGLPSIGHIHSRDIGRTRLRLLGDEIAVRATAQKGSLVGRGDPAHNFPELLDDAWHERCFRQRHPEEYRDDGYGSISPGYLFGTQQLLHEIGTVRDDTIDLACRDAFDFGRLINRPCINLHKVHNEMRHETATRHCKQATYVEETLLEFFQRYSCITPKTQSLRFGASRPSVAANHFTIPCSLAQTRR